MPGSSDDPPKSQVSSVEPPKEQPASATANNVAMAMFILFKNMISS
jgi:hypothetical protein